MRLRPAFVIATGAALLAALGVGTAWRNVAFDPDSPASRPSAAPATASPPSRPQRTALGPHPPRPADPAAQGAVADPTQARAALAAQAERERFERRVRDFLAGSASIDATGRARIAAELDAQVEVEELAQRMSADEARMLRLALIERGTDDPGERVRRAEALADAYRREAERRWRVFDQQQANDPAFRAYKAREAAIVVEVAALRTIPGGLHRDEYLRQRLQAERERAYATTP